MKCNVALYREIKRLDKKVKVCFLVEDIVNDIIDLCAKYATKVIMDTHVFPYS